MHTFFRRYERLHILTTYTLDLGYSSKLSFVLILIVNYQRKKSLLCVTNTSSTQRKVRCNVGSWRKRGVVAMIIVMHEYFKWIADNHKQWFLQAMSWVRLLCCTLEISQRFFKLTAQETLGSISVCLCYHIATIIDS